MKLDKSNLVFIFWFVLSWGLIVFSKFGDEINQIVLKIIVPILFFTLFFIEGAKIKLNLSLIFYVVFALWASISVFYTENMELTLKYLQGLLGNIILWYLTLRILENIENRNRFLFILGSAFIFHGILGIIVPPENELSFRMQGVYTNPNGLGFAMWYGIIIFIYFYLISEIKIKRIMFMSILFFLFWILIFTASRKSVLATIISVAIVLYYKNIFDLKKIIIFFPILYFLYFNLSTYILDKTPLGIRLDSNNIEKSADIRTELVSEGINFFIEQPFVGIGLGSFTSYSSSGLMSHNDYIEILSSTGIIGFGIYILIFWVFFKQTKILLRNPETFYLGIISRSFLIGYLVLGMGRPAFLDPVAIILFASFQGLVQIEINKIKKMRLSIE